MGVFRWGLDMDDNRERTGAKARAAPGWESVAAGAGSGLGLREVGKEKGRFQFGGLQGTGEDGRQERLNGDKLEPDSSKKRDREGPRHQTLRYNDRDRDRRRALRQRSRESLLRDMERWTEPAGDKGTK